MYHLIFSHISSCLHLQDQPEEERGYAVLHQLPQQEPAQHPQGPEMPPETPPLNAQGQVS